MTPAQQIVLLELPGRALCADCIDGIISDLPETGRALLTPQHPALLSGFKCDYFRGRCNMCGIVKDVGKAPLH